MQMTSNVQAYRAGLLTFHADPAFSEAAIDAVRQWEFDATLLNGEPIVAPRDGYLVFPNPTAKPGEVLFYFGVASARDV